MVRCLGNPPTIKLYLKARLYKNVPGRDSRERKRGNKTIGGKYLIYNFLWLRYNLLNFEGHRNSPGKFIHSEIQAGGW
jgi:hypothetical protein